MTRTSYRTRALHTLLAIIIALLLSACVMFSPSGDGSDLPPILTQDELIRPYTEIGRIRITIDQYIFEPSNLQEWGFGVIQNEAARMGADAVIMPEVSSRPTSYLIFPSNEYRATGIAIKFK